MTERRSLLEGLHATPTPLQKLEAEFVYGAKASEQSTAKPTPPATSQVLNRVPVSTRIRSDLANALKRASLERQLSGQQPNTLQDILEEAIEPWLTANGYLS